MPSLVNRYYVLDLLPERSFLRHLAGHGLRPLVVDWGAPVPPKSGSIWPAVSTGSTAPLPWRRRSPASRSRCSATAWAACSRWRWRCAASGRSPGLAVLATPWDFHAERQAQAHLLGPCGRLSGGSRKPAGNAAGRAHPEPVLSARPVSRRAQIRALCRARPGERGGARFCRARGLDQRRRAVAADGGARMPALMVRRQRTRPRGMAGRRADQSARKRCAGRRSSSFPAATASSRRPRPSRWRRPSPRPRCCGRRSAMSG